MFEKYDIKEIRILTTSSELEFETEEEIRDYLNHELPKDQEGKYWYREKGIEVEGKDILVIFWYKNKGIGCGILHNRVKEKFGIYSGYLEFYPETVFNICPISEEEIHRFSDIPKQVLQRSPKIEMKALDGVLKMIYEKWKAFNFK